MADEDCRLSNQQGVCVRTGFHAFHHVAVMSFQVRTAFALLFGSLCLFLFLLSLS